MARLNEETARNKAAFLSESSNPKYSEESLNKTILDVLSGKESSQEEKENDEKSEPDFDNDIDKLLEEVGTARLGKTRFKLLQTYNAFSVPFVNKFTLASTYLGYDVPL